jgi:hypothetical protein
MTEQICLNPTLKKALAKMEKWFSDEHDKMYAEHEKAAKAKDGLFCKIFEAAIGGHDRAWVQWEYFLYDLNVSFDEILKWRKGEVES